jgi:hypothetical protein
LSVCPAEGNGVNPLFCTFQSPKTLQSDNLFFLLHVVLHVQTHRGHVRATESTQYSRCIRLTLALGGLANLLSPKLLNLCGNDSVEVLRHVTSATPYGNPGRLPLSNPTKCRKLGQHGTIMHHRNVLGMPWHPCTNTMRPRAEIATVRSCEFVA